MKKELKVGNIIRIPGNKDYEFWVCIMIEHIRPWFNPHDELVPGMETYMSSILWYEDPDGKPCEKGEWASCFGENLRWYVPNEFTAHVRPRDISLASEPPPKQSHQKQNRTPAREGEWVDFCFTEIPK